MKSLLKLATAALLALGFAPFCFAGVPYSDYEYEACGTSDSGLDASDLYLQCNSYICIAWFRTCGPLDPKAKYRIHFDTQEPFFYEEDDCLTTSDDTVMYRNGKVTGPGYLHHLIEADGQIIGAAWWLSYDELGIEVGDDIFAWLDVHRKGIQDRVPDTYVDELDTCAKPQDAYPPEVIAVCAADDSSPATCGQE